MKDILESEYGRHAHPREEHLLPLHVVVGAGGGAKATIIYTQLVNGAFSLDSYKFGN
jgi:aromatic ring-opening dioxygenase catalytic subunit (LigB family)